MANNVLRETDGQETFVSSNQIASKVIEDLVGFSTDERLEKYLEAFKADLRTIANDKFASHVLQKLVSVSSLRALSTNGENSNFVNERAFNFKSNHTESHKRICNAFVVTVSKFLLNNIEDFINDQYGNHVLRTCLLSLAGIENIETLLNDTEVNELGVVPGPSKAWIEIVEEYTNRLRVWPQFVEFPFEELTSGFMQSLFCSLKVVNKDLLKSIGGFLLHESFANKPEEEDKKIGRVFSTKSSIRYLMHSFSPIKNILITFMKSNHY